MFASASYNMDFIENWMVNSFDFHLSTRYFVSVSIRYTSLTACIFISKEERLQFIQSIYFFIFLAHVGWMHEFRTNTQKLTHSHTIHTHTNTQARTPTRRNNRRNQNKKMFFFFLFFRQFSSSTSTAIASSCWCCFFFLLLLFLLFYWGRHRRRCHRRRRLSIVVSFTHNYFFVAIPFGSQTFGFYFFFFFLILSTILYIDIS